MICEVRAGNGPILFDCSKMSAEDVETMRPRAGWMGLNGQEAAGHGHGLFRQKLEWMPQVRHTYGGIVADLDGATAIKACTPPVWPATPTRCLHGRLGHLHHGHHGLFRR